MASKGVPAFGFFLFLIGSLIVFTHKNFHQYLIKKFAPLKPDSISSKLWENNGVPKFFNIYFFNWTNPEEINDPTKKPNLVQVGPYVYKIDLQKVNVTFNYDTVTYYQKRTWQFDSKLSKGTLQDKITQLNMVAASAVFKSRFWDSEMQDMTASLMQEFNTKLHIVKTVDELLFSGYTDELLDAGRASGFDANPYPFERFAWLYNRNESSEFDGCNTIGTGVNDFENLGKLKEWNHRKTSKFFRSPENILGGSLDLFSPFQTGQNLRFFSADICKSIDIEKLEEVSTFGARAYKYSISKKTLGDNTEKCDPRDPNDIEDQDINQDIFTETYSSTNDFDDSTSASMDFDLDSFENLLNDDDTPQETSDVAENFSLDENEAINVDSDVTTVIPDIIDSTTTVSDTEVFAQVENISADEENDLNPVTSPLESDAVTDKQQVNTDENPCHCNGECSPIGLINVTACRYGAPIFMSLPHFYDGEDVLKNAVTGLNPQADKHNFYFALEPVTGVPLDVAVRMQVNVLLRPSKNYNLVKNVPEIYFPVFWFELRAGIPNEMILMLLMFLYSLQIAGVFMMGFGLIIFYLSVFRRLEVQEITIAVVDRELYKNSFHINIDDYI